MTQIHVVPSADEWAVRRDGGDEVSTFATQAEATDFGRGLARDEQAELVVHGEDGQIRAKDSHGNDPRATEG